MSFTPVVQDAEPPEYILAAMGGDYDRSKYRWNQDNMSLVDRKSGGGSYSFANTPDPSKGTDVVTDQSEFNRTGQAQQNFAPGEQPFFGFGDGQETFISADPNAISQYKDGARSRNWQGIAKVAAVVGGGAFLGKMLGGAGAGAGKAVAGKAAAAGADGLTPISVGAKAMAGGVPSINAAAFGAAPAAAKTGLFSKVGSWMSNNKDIVGNLVGGIGDAMGANAQHENDIDLLRERNALTSANYGAADPAKAYRGLSPRSAATPETTRFDAYSGWHYGWNPQTGTFERMKDTA